MRTYHTLILFLLSFCTFSSTYAQFDHCPTLQLCNGYFHLEGDFPPDLGPYIINVNDLAGTYSYIYNDIVPIDGNLSIQMEDDYPDKGKYIIYSWNAGFIICEGEFTNSKCVDYLLPESMDCNIEGGIFQIEEKTPCDSLDVIHYNFRGFCLGDTSRINITPDQLLLIPNATLPFTLDRLQLNNGYVISYDEFGFDVVWDVVGTECILLNTTLMGDLGATTAISVRVDPQEDIEIYANGTSTNTIEICVGESVHLNTNQYEFFSTIWQVDNSDYYYGRDYSKTFDIPGTYEVILKPTIECNCATPDTLLVKVLPGEMPSINCTGTVCAGNEVTYYSDTECANYIWSIGSQGIIIDGGGPLDYFVTVQWIFGPAGDLTLSTPGCYTNPCRETVTEVIPIIGNTANIIGPDEVCYGERVQYSMIDYTGTEFEWALDGPGYIVGSSTRNPVHVQWLNSDPSNSATITLEFNNCNLNCSGSASYDVSLLQDIYIELGDRKYCEQADLSVSNNLGYAVDWEIINPDGSSTTYSNSPILVATLNAIGSYSIILSNPNSPTCNSKDEVTFKIFGNPLPPDSIDGPKVICKDKFVQYSIPNLGSYDLVHWQVFDGDLNNPTDNFTTRNLTIAWSSDGPYQLSASIENSVSRCISEISLGVFDAEFNLEGLDTICLAKESVYTLSPYYGGEIEWTITPTSAAEVVYSQGDIASIVALGEGSFTVTATYCAFSKSVDVHVPIFNIDISFDEIVCEDALSSVNVVAPNGSTISIKKLPENIIISSSIDNMLPASEYLVEVTSPYDCEYSEEIKINEYDTFEAEISSPGPFVFCMPHDPIPIYAVSPGSGYTYMWYHNGALLAETSSTLLANDYGTYYVIISDQNGCLSERSDNINLAEPDNVPGPPLVIETTDITCHHKSFTVLQPYTSTEFIWSFGDGSVATGTVVEHTYTRAGYFLVIVGGNGGCGTFTNIICDNEVTDDACEGGATLVTIPLVAEYEYENACVNAPTQFIDQSSILPGVVPIYNWTFIDPVNGDSYSTSSNPNHIFTDVGSYIVQLELTDPVSNCVSVIEKTITVSELPDAIFDIDLNSCLGHISTFTGSSSDNNLSYLWQFGEIINGREQISRLQNAEYTYTTSGNHLVQLTITNPNGCKKTLSQIVNSSSNTLNGQISSDSTYPKCPGEAVTLTAPLADFYVWNTTETTSQITVIDPGNYQVTISNSEGCDYTTYPHLVSDVNLANGLISATVYDGDIIGQITHYDELSVCQGQPFTIQANYVANASYTWTGEGVNGANTQELSYNSFSLLTAGTYEFYVNIRDTLTNCESDFGPFELTIVANPPNAILVSDINPVCFGDYVTISISNYNPNFTYIWNNGHTGETFTGIAENGFFVDVSNSNGCTAGSNYLAVRRPPSVDAWLTGCMEVCFPKEICLRLTINQTIDYTLLKDGEVLSGINPPISILDIDEPGEYQLRAVNNYGCESISEILSLNASPDEHQLSGIVYIDFNQNSTYDLGDSLLANVPVSLLNGNTIVVMATTDANGSYLFDPIEYTNLTTLIDISGINLMLAGDLDSLLIYSECVEEKIINFPLINTCPFIGTDSLYTVCQGESITIGASEYYENESDTLTYLLAGGCDSTFIIHVKAINEPEITLLTEGTCQDTDSGSLYIDILNGSNLLFSLDSELITFTDTFYHGLTAGAHILKIYHNNQCSFSVPFDIATISPPSVDISPISSCFNTNNGSITIDIELGSNLTFSLSENGNFTDDLYISNLSAGNQILYYRDENNCDYSQAFTIDTFEEPEISIEPNGTCLDKSRGDIFINVISGSNLLFRTENSSYASDLTYNNLPDGEHTLFILDDNGCEYQSTFIIPLFPPSQFSFDVINACGNEGSGKLTISPISQGIQFSIDNEDNFDMATQYSNLEIGTHIIYSISPDGCVDSIPFLIESITNIEISYNIQSACELIGFGFLEIDSIHQGGLFAIDNGEYSEDLYYEQLAAGQHVLLYQYDEECIFEFPFEILLIELPMISIEVVSSCAESDSGILIIDSNNPNLEYSIDNNEYVETDTFAQLAADQYILYVRSEENCTVEYPFEISPLPPLILNAHSENSCPNLATGSITIDNLEEGQEVSINGMPIGSESHFENLSEGQYLVEIIDSYGCRASTSLDIMTNPPLIIDTLIPSSDCYPQAFIINPDPISSHGPIEYLWHDGSTSPQYLASKTETVTLNVSDECQTRSFEWNLVFSSAVDFDNFSTPNIFSPNGDGVNDCFSSTINPAVELISYHHIIFDRWGNKMFDTNDHEDCWDGVYKDEPAITGVYVYITTVIVRECNRDREIQKIGDVTILR